MIDFLNVRKEKSEKHRQYVQSLRNQKTYGLAIISMAFNKYIQENVKKKTNKKVKGR